MLFANPKAERRRYDEALKAIMNIDLARESRQWLQQWDMLARQATALRSMGGLSRRLGVGSISIKDESQRSPLASFKALGAPIALVRLIQRRWPARRFEAGDLFAGRHAQSLQDFVVISATDGNHGRALAAAARSVGCRCVIVLHAHVSAEREAPIAALGAQIIRVTGNYDDSVQEAARLARLNDWEVVSDTSYDGYEEVPRDVMQGYGVIVDELFDGVSQGDACPFTHVFLQGGVGGLAAGIVSYFWERFGAQRPIFIVVEPEQAACLMQSAKLGRATRAIGSIDSLMAGLACGETSPLAWRFLQPTIDFFMTVADEEAERAMRTLANAPDGDVPIVSGESGAAGLAALEVLIAQSSSARSVGLEARSNVLLLNTEGATAPGVYRALTGRAATEILEAQDRWLAAH